MRSSNTQRSSRGTFTSRAPSMFTAVTPAKRLTVSSITVKCS